MRTITNTLIFAALGLVLACDDTPNPGPVAPTLDPAAGDLVGLLPSSTLAAMEFPELAGRWDEIRAIPRLARLQNHLLRELGLDASDVPAIAGGHAVLALVAAETSRRLVPVGVLDPQSALTVLKHLAAIDGLIAVEARGAIWMGPVSQAPLVERVAAGDGTSIRDAIDTAALAERLPAGGLVRAVLNPAAIRTWLQRWAESASARLTGPLAAVLAADLEAIEVAGFRRDIVAGELVTDGWLGIDMGIVPEAFARSLGTHRGSASLPDDLPANVLLANSFRTEAEAGLAWLRTLAARNPDGPLRNFDFWIGEFEARSGRDVETDIVAALGERGLFVALEGGDEAALEFVAIFDAGDPQRLEASLVDLRDWLGDHIWGRTFGLAIPQRRGAGDESGGEHGLAFWSPFGTVNGPVFQIADDRLVIATSQQSLSYGIELARSAATWRTPAWAIRGGHAPDEIAIIRTPALARLLAAETLHAAVDDRWLSAVHEFLAGTREARMSVVYDEAGFRFHGALPIDASSM
jgi:hypothetical protein